MQKVFTMLLGVFFGGNLFAGEMTFTSLKSGHDMGLLNKTITLHKGSGASSDHSIEIVMGKHVITPDHFSANDTLKFNNETYKIQMEASTKGNDTAEGVAKVSSMKGKPLASYNYTFKFDK